ncbi:MAG: hypothetical protein DRH33_04935 [Candidatus Nealsonbacteria bacterium]|nr:MAG: hypothetical protein DRH33_04935 [Candidatus Nealsonbacteria bacterium]
MILNWGLFTIIIALNLTLGVLVLTKNPKEKINRSFFWMVLFTTFWTTANYLENENLKISLRAFFLRLDFAIAPFLSLFFLLFCVNFSKHLLKKTTIIFLLVLGGILGFFSFSNYLIKNICITNGTIIFKISTLFPLYALFIIATITLGCYKLIVFCRKSTGLRRLQSLYILIGLSLTAFILLLLNLVLPQIIFVPLSIGRLGIYSLIIFIFFSFYTIVKYRLMDIRVVMGKGAIYIFSFLSVIGMSFLLIFLNQKLAQPIPFNIFFSSVIIVSVLLFQLFFRLFEKIASRYFYYTFYSYQTVLTDLGRRLTQVLDLKKLASLITSTLIRTMKLDRTVILLRDPQTRTYRIIKNIGFREENGISLVKDNFLTRYLEKTQKPLVYEELSLAIRDIKDEGERKNLEKLKQNMRKIEAALCLPLFRERKIIGLIVLGNKISRDPYSQQDLELLTTLSGQASIAFQNAILYSQVEDLSQNLQQKVQEQTKELRKAYQELKTLDKAKSEFISMASHQLRTPLTSIKGYISMILEGDYGQIPPKAKKALESVFQSNERLIRIVNDLLNISRIELGKMELQKSPTKIEELIQTCYEEIKNEASKKNLKLVFKKPETPLPVINIDSLKIQQVILNLLDNALRYTKKGKIEIALKKKPNSILISVKDTGEGLTRSEQKQIFEGFSRGSAGINLFIEGAGLGLYVSKKYLDLHKGKIWAESPGKGKGSTFYVELPLR